MVIRKPFWLSLFLKAEPNKVEMFGGKPHIGLLKIFQKQAVAELYQAQVQVKLDSNFLGEDLYMFIQKLDQEIKRLKYKNQMQFRCNLAQHIKILIT